MIKLKDSTHLMTKEEYELNILYEVVKKLKSGKAKFYTHKEFWKIVRKRMNCLRKYKI